MKIKINSRYPISLIKLNYNCPESEKSGSGPGSCSGSSGTSSERPVGKFEKAAIKGAALSIKDAGTSKLQAGKILDQPKEVLDNYLNEAAINEWTENYLPSRPDIEGTDAQEKQFVDAFKKELTYQLEKKAGRKK